jgi:uncharacterized protein YbdZ (MbtH family)
MEENDPFDTYSVVVNHEEQYSIWPTERDIPAGWNGVGKVGTKQECLDYIETVWTDMRPLSLRKKMEEWQKNPPPPLEDDASFSDEPSLVDRLCNGRHLLTASLRPERSVNALRQAIDRGYVLVKFTETRGQTEIGMDLEPAACDFSKADFDKASGSIRLSGTLSLDFEKVRCIADIDLATLEGQGHLEKRVAEVA